MVSRAIVAGGGIGGIPAAIALCKAGFEVKVGIPGVYTWYNSPRLASHMHAPLVWLARLPIARCWNMHVRETVSSCTSHAVEVGEFMILQGYV